MFNTLHGLLSRTLDGFGFSPPLIEGLNSFVSLILFVLVVLAAAKLSSAILVRLVEKIVRRTRVTWDDSLAESHFFLSLSRLIPVIAAYFIVPEFVKTGGVVEEYVRRVILAALALTVCHICAAFFDGVNLIYQKSAAETAKRKPIKGAVQLIKVFLYLVGVILSITTLVNVSPLGILSGLGAMSAVLLLIFKDSILGFVSGIQLSMNDMVRIGDWIEMSAYNTDGFVIDITLQSVKVQNWDNTISMIPVYALVSDGFKNWRGMSDSGGRRVKRSIYLDQHSVHFLSEEEIERLSRIKLIEEYLRQKRQEISANPELRLTNLGTFRAYTEAYINGLPGRAGDLLSMVRYLQPNESGIQMEIYLFCADKAIVNYERFQADIMDHLLAILSEFGLRVFQNLSGGDMQLIAGQIRAK
ncbi:MAG: mechanosensitive ion channel family protein [Spirochaetaceae bacterium]|nr:mechanosensitive ion channel family protein [Spirochaetaceae bacterium]